MQQLAERVSELEKRLKATEELLARFVRFDEGSETVVLAPHELRTQRVSVVHAFAVDDSEEEDVRIGLYVDDESDENGDACIAVWDQQGNPAVLILVEADTTEARFSHKGMGRASILAEATDTWIEVLSTDGEKPAVRMSRDGDAARLDLYRVDGTSAAAVGAAGDLAFVSLFDAQGKYATVQMVNGGDNNNLATIEGWRSQRQRAFALRETADGEGGELLLWAASRSYAWRSYAHSHAAGFAATDSRGEDVIQASSNDRSRAIVVFDYLQKDAAGCAVDVAGNIGLLGETVRGVNIELI